MAIDRARRRLLRLLLGSGALLAAATAAAEPPTYTLAVVPAQLPLAAHASWQPLADHLAQRLNARIELKIYRMFARFETDLTQAVPDFAFVNPYHVLMAYKRQRYVPLVRSSRTLTGILVVRADDPIASVKALERRTLAFPSPNAFGASLYMRALLTEQAGIRFTPYYLDGHSEVYRHVILGEAAAGGGIRQSLEREPPEVRAKLRVLYETPATVGHALAAHPRVPAADREAVIEAILALGERRGTPDLLGAVQLDDPVRADYARDYRPLERLGLDRYAARPN
jgi:phosphonate transport system substrate-binding protein